MTLACIAWRRITMKTFVTISGGILLALSCVATSDARLHANREGQTQSEPSNYNPDYNSQTNTRNWDNSCLHCGAASRLPSYATLAGGIRHRRIKWQCLAPPSKWPQSLCPPMS